MLKDPINPMTPIAFKFIIEYGREKSTNVSIYEFLIDKFIIPSGYSKILLEGKININNVEVICIDDLINDFITASNIFSKYESRLNYTKDICIMITFFVPDDVMEKPILNYMLDKNIRRACWTINEQRIDIKNTFFDINHIIVGYDDHYTGDSKSYLQLRGGSCYNKQCDLVSFHKRSYGGIGDVIEIYSRKKRYCFKYGDTDIFLNLPAVCNKSTIIKLFLNEIKNNNMCDSENDFDLYLCKLDYKPFSYTQTDYWSIKIDNNDDFIIDSGGPYESIFRDQYFIRHNYAFAKKHISLCNFFELTQLPKDISEIIYLYVNFESTRPDAKFVLKNNTC